MKVLDTPLVRNYNILNAQFITRIVIFIILGFPLHHELPGDYSHKPTQKDNFIHHSFFQFLSQEAKYQFFQKHAEIVHIVKSMSETKLLYFLILSSTIDSEKNLTINYDTMRMVFNVFSDNKKTESEVIGKYIKTIFS